MKTMRALTRPIILSLLLAVILTLGACGPIFDYVLCHDQKGDCSTQEND
jgi:hypothetical protein